MNHECIAAFLDDEPFDAEELRRSLATEEGRAFLIDSLALRDLVQPDETPVAAQVRRRPSRWLTVAAAIAISAGGGYWLGQRAEFMTPLHASRIEAFTEPPAPRAPMPTHVIRLEPGFTWYPAEGN